MPIWLPSGLRRTNRKCPPTLRSTSHVTSNHPLGPNQCLSRSGLVNASNTNVRGALNTRVSTIWFAVGVVTANVPVFFIDAFPFFSSYCEFWYRALWSVLFDLCWSIHQAGHPDARNFLPRS